MPHQKAKAGGHSRVPPVFLIPGSLKFIFRHQSYQLVQR